MAGCFFDPRYDECLKEQLILTAAAVASDAALRFLRCSCQGPLPPSHGVAINCSHLQEMHTGWGDSAGPYPQFRLHAAAGQLITQANILTVMRQRQLGPLRRRQRQQQQLPTFRRQRLLAEASVPLPLPLPAPIPAPTSPTTLAANGDADGLGSVVSCEDYRQLKLRLQEQREQRRLQRQRRRQPAVEATDDTVADADADADAKVDGNCVEDRVAESGTADDEVKTAPNSMGELELDGFQLPALSLSFSYAKFKERFGDWESVASSRNPDDTQRSSPASVAGTEMRTAQMQRQRRLAPVHRLGRLPQRR